MDDVISVRNDTTYDTDDDVMIVRETVNLVCDDSDVEIVGQDFLDPMSQIMLL